jgi:cell wall-associated NlpC family hydrolase
MAGEQHDRPGLQMRAGRCVGRSVTLNEVDMRRMRGASSGIGIRWWLVAACAVMQGCTGTTGWGLRGDADPVESVRSAEVSLSDAVARREASVPEDKTATSVVINEEPGARLRSRGGAPASIDVVGLLGHALSLEGTRYRRGGNSPEAGFDCSGFVSYLYRDQGVHLPRSSADMYVALPEVARPAMRPGDLVLFRISGKRVSHVGLYIGGDRFIHATSSRTKRVMVSSLTEPYWRKTWAGARRPYRTELGKAVAIE